MNERLAHVSAAGDVVDIFILCTLAFSINQLYFDTARFVFINIDVISTSCPRIHLLLIQCLEAIPFYRQEF